MALHFDSIDAKKGTARLIGNQGSADVFSFMTQTGVHFMEQTGTGAVNVTTVFAEYAAGTQNFMAVTSRHLSIDGPFTSQWQGTCKTWD